MIPLIHIIALVFMPYEPVTSTVHWYDEKVIEIEKEPTLDDIEWDIRKRELQERFRIIEGTGQ